MKFGLVTYQWGKDWSLPILIKNCEGNSYEVVELRTEYEHETEFTVSLPQRKETKNSLPTVQLLM